MPKWLKKALGWLALLAFVAVTTIGLWGPPLFFRLFEKDYYFPEVAVDVRLLPDGDALIEETRTFAFRNGPFTYAYFTVDDPGGHVQDFHIYEETASGEREISPDYAFNTGPQFKAQWSYETTDEERTWVFRYRYDDAIDRFADAQHFYWQLIGSGWEKPTEHFRGVVRLPEGTDTSEVRAWGHGPLNGSVSFANNRSDVVFEVRDIPPQNYVEASVLLPAGTTAGPAEMFVARDRIIADEARWTEEANAMRDRHDEERARVFYLMFGVPLLLAGFVLMSRLRDRVPGAPKVLSEPPEDDVVEAAFLWDAWLGRNMPLNAYRAQLLRLVRLGAVEIRAVGTVSDPEDIRLVQRKGADEVETATDMDFLALLFGDPTDPEHVNEISVSDPTRHGESGPTWFKEWNEDAKSDIGKALLHIRKGDARIESTGSAVVAVIAAGYGIWTAVWGVGGAIGWLLVPVAGFALIVALRSIPARVGPEIRERIAKLAAFRRYLKDFSSLPDAPALAVIIWEQYMEWAVALYVAKRVEKQIKALIPAEQVTTKWMGEGIDSTRAFRTMNSLALSANSLAFTAGSRPSTGSTSGGFGSSSSSSGFSSGGFSGGGGGGHGGSGGGAG